MDKIIDAHIHLDHYDDDEIDRIIATLEQVHCDKIITVSFDLASCKKNLLLAEKYSKVVPAFGFHPEQAIPTDVQFAELLAWMEKHQNKMCAIGEIGLPYYSRPVSIDPYVELLDTFLKLAKKWDKPVVLHAVYDDAPIVCDLLEKNNIENAHFHWFKGDEVTVSRMINNGYHISVTPDVLYETEIQQLVQKYPLGQMMAETDGPWQFEDVFSKEMTHPKMIHQSIAKIATIKKESLTDVYQVLYENTIKFYNI
ncbi:TatD family hydrolase [Bacillus sp. FSL K6-3431]|uniref:TatD family hydrolase n=1 Tax=Bacillus sp. FSL K6-3431 TaxID=2921500 RepID=UPI0030F6BB29